MPELPEGTINAFIQNKNLAKYGLLKDNEGGYLAENFVDYQLIDRHETLEEIVAVGWMSDSVWKSTSASGAPENSSLSHFSATTRPCWPLPAVMNRHCHAIEQAPHRWRGGRRDDSARMRRKV